jgi:hypothetical protein
MALQANSANDLTTKGIWVVTVLESGRKIDLAENRQRGRRRGRDSRCREMHYDPKRYRITNYTGIALNA